MRQTMNVEIIGRLLQRDGRAQSSVRSGSTEDEGLAGGGDRNRVASCVVGKHRACTLGKRLFLHRAETRTFETERLSYQRNHDAVRSQTTAPRVHLDLPALVNRDGERWKKEDVAI